MSPPVVDRPSRVPADASLSGHSCITGAVRAVIIGAGLMGRWHGDAIAKAGGRVVAVVDRASDRAERLARSHAGSRVFISVESALRSINADIVHVCTPVELHVSTAEASMAASRHVLVEKPLAATARETERLVRLAEEADVLICPVHQFVFQDGVRRALRWLRAIGDVVHIEMTFCSAGGSGRVSARLDEIAAEILPHPLSLTQLFAPALFARNAWEVRRPAPGELRVAIGGGGGATASILVSMRARPTVSAMSILGEAGTIHVDLFHGYAVLEPGAVSRAHKILHPFDRSARGLFAASANMARRILRWEPAYPGLRTLVREMYDAVRGGGPSPISPAGCIAVARARDAILDAAGMNIALEAIHSQHASPSAR
jgi:predicted dehydrogenase